MEALIEARRSRQLDLNELDRVAKALRLDLGFAVGHIIEALKTGGPAEAAIVERMFREFVAGVSPKQFAKNLNHEGVPGPFAGAWSPNTIYGNAKRGTGILNNELYAGRLVWNRPRYVKNPDTGKRVSRLNPTSEWISKDVPELRIVPDDLWTPETRTEASEALRGLIDAIVLTPNQGELQIELKGNLAAMLGAAKNAKRSPETGDRSLQVVMIARACNQRSLQLWSGAA